MGGHSDPDQWSHQSEPFAWALARALNGFLCPGTGSWVVVCERTYPFPFWYGRVPISQTALALALARLVGPGLDAGRVLFLDLETTGLVAAAGDCAVLVGLATLEGHGLRLRQLLLLGLAGEPALLTQAQTHLSRCHLVVTFNGRQFDLPFLAARLAERRQPFVPPAGHLDLLDPARRLWRESLGSCRLEVLERMILGVDRGPDLPGQQIPAQYEAFLRSGDPQFLHPILAHNAADLLALVALLVAVGQSR